MSNLYRHYLRQKVLTVWLRCLPHRKLPRQQPILSSRKYPVKDNRPVFAPAMYRKSGCGIIPVILIVPVIHRLHRPSVFIAGRQQNNTPGNIFDWLCRVVRKARNW
ncbi:hypothetical protein KCP75_16400 [Salmonella enterica subsp. enterica]|nr:hypothetical protein KCP75_16400 [Salmonella enterica subsp. enterica]